MYKPVLFCVALLFLLSACASSNNPNTAPVATSSATRAVSIATAMPTPTQPVPTVGPVPRNCPVSTPMFHTSSALAPVIGASPVWATWPRDLGPFHLVSPSDSFSTYEAPYGWAATKMIWEVGPHYTHPVTIRGYDLNDHTPLLFQLSDDTPTASAVLEPGHPDHPYAAYGEDWEEWGSYLVVPKAGCYVMVVSWPTNHWSVTFAAGA